MQGRLSIRDPQTTHTLIERLPIDEEDSIATPLPIHQENTNQLEVIAENHSQEELEIILLITHESRTTCSLHAAD